jgi:Protein of unknown function (DUF3040)
VALPMDEQRILEEMERMLAADDPKLAARLAAFGQPGFGQVLRTRRARATLSIMLLILIAAVAAVIYLMSALKSGAATGGPGHPSSSTTTSAPAGRTQNRISGVPHNRTSARPSGTVPVTVNCAPGCKPGPKAVSPSGG